MKKLYYLLVILSVFTTIKAQIINIPDANFKAKLLAANNTNLIALDAINNPITIDVNANGEIEVSEALTVFKLDVNYHYYTTYIQNLSGIEYFSNLSYLNCNWNNLTSLDVSALSNLAILDCSRNLLTSLTINGLTNLRDLNCYNNSLESINFSGLSNLQQLNCSYNKLISLDVSGLTALLYLDCQANILVSLNCNGLSNLQTLHCEYNLFTSLDFSGFGLTNLEGLICYQNKLTYLNCSGLPKLVQLTCWGNQISSLNISGLSKLTQLACSSNSLTSLDVSGLTSLNILDCSNNYLTSLDVNNSDSLYSINFTNNPYLTSVFMKNKNGFITIGYPLNGLPNLQYICANEKDAAFIQWTIDTYGYPNCNVNSYCSFTPGGEFYTIQGNNKYDSNNDGCDVSDTAFPHLIFSITNAITSGRIIPNLSGNYSLPVQAGAHTITPILENTNYFDVSPPTINVTFPSQTSPFAQSFCVTAKGVHPDLEVSLLTISLPRPGFDTNYKIIYKNKGTNTQSGTVTLTFNDAILDFVSSNPILLNQVVNSLSWNFENLLPFETREINFIININSPIEIPAVNAGDILNYIVVITSDATDETPNDNTFVSSQTARNSWDPNDKTCLEGNILAPENIGEYVHYLIRFENKGTANAQNIVVKDIIDVDKFDIASLVPIEASHSFVTRITEGNKVEFIFENIDLPFDDSTNDGFISFKIKTKPTLVVGDSFDNNASIYFDYNFPIVTNIAKTTISALSKQNFEFNYNFTLSPNPTKDVLYINVTKDVQLYSLSVYNILGQTVLVVAEPTNSTDVSSLKTGSYFVKIVSNKGSSSCKFIKE